MVYGIPTELRYESELCSYYEGLGIGKVESVVICRKWTKLREAVQMRAFNLSKLEQIYSAVLESTQKKRSRAFLFYSGNGNSSLDSVVDFDVDESSADLIRIRFSENDSTDASIFEIMSRLDAVSPRFRPRHRIGFLGLFGSSVDSAEFYAQQFREWDKKVEELRKFPETSSATAVGFVTFESPESAVLCAQGM